MSNVPEGAQLSEDGQWWWDGENWKPVEGAGDAGGGGGGEPPAGAGGEVTADDLAVYNDTGPEPGDDSNLKEEHKEYFQADYDSAPNDESYGETSAEIDESQFTGPAAGENEGEAQ